MAKYDIFLVDADGTLLDFHGVSILAVEKAFVALGLEKHPEFDKIYTRVNDGLWERLERKEITREELIKIRFPLYLDAMGMDSSLGDRFSEIYLDYLSSNPMFIDGAQTFLKELRKHGRVYIVTNGTARIQRKRFAVCDLYSYADDVFISDEIGYDKPSGKYTEFVMAHIPDFDRGKAVWIGDSLTADIRAARDANIQSIWVNFAKKTLKGDVVPDAVAESYADVLRILGLN